jgi:hypothetical protein
MMRIDAITFAALMLCVLALIGWLVAFKLVRENKRLRCELMLFKFYRHE